MGRYVNSDPNIKENWHFIEIGYPESLKLDYKGRQLMDEERKAWCIENSHGRWSKDHKRELDQYGRSSWKYGYFFCGPNDAMLFKLTFAGGL